MTAKIRLKIKRRERTRKSEIKEQDVGKLRKKEVKEEFIKEATANIQNTQLQEVEVVNEIWNKINKGINEAAGKITAKEERPQRNSWFEEECQITSKNEKGAQNKAIDRNVRKK